MTYEEALFVAQQLKEEMSVTSEEAFYGLFNFSFPDSSTLQGHLCRYLCY